MTFSFPPKSYLIEHLIFISVNIYTLYHIGLLLYIYFTATIQNYLGRLTLLKHRLNCTI